MRASSALAVNTVAKPSSVYMRAVGGTREGKDAEPVLPVLAAEEKLGLVKLAHAHHTTQPPPRYTEATLLSAMEGAGVQHRQCAR